MTSPEVEAYLRRRTGIMASEEGVPLAKRIFRSKWAWTGAALVVLSIVAIWVLIIDVMKTRVYEDGTKIPGLNSDALWMSAGRAWPTLAFWIICFILVDRYKPQRLLVWFLVLAWGGCVAVAASYYLNNWVAAQIAVINQAAGTTGERLAVFVAPFVEEGTKACVIFLIAALDRNRFTSRVSGAVVGGLAGAGFAFTENIIYYARAVVYGSYTPDTGDVMAGLDYMVLMRGIFTCFGHPLFTLMTGLGVAFAVTTRSKTVRVVAPLAGYLFAAFLHMFFNWRVSNISEQELIRTVVLLAWPVVILVAVRLVISVIRQGRTVSARLGDYVSMGWLPSDYPASFSRVRTRAWTLLMSLWHANPIKTWTMQVKVTELAMLREAITRGTVDRGGLWKEHELIDEIADLARRGGLADGTGLRPYWPWKRRKRASRTDFSASMSPSAVQQKTGGSSLKYSAVDPRWRPPS